MGREIKRVPVDFDWPINKVWQGFLTPDRFREIDCPDCEAGWSAHAEHLTKLWYGWVPFSPEDNGSVPFVPSDAAVQAVARRNVERAPQYYGLGDAAVSREAARLCALVNSQWSHHLNADDVAALVEADRLWDFTRTWTAENGWQKPAVPVVPTPEQVNAWSLSGFGHDSLNKSAAIRARCEREGQQAVCPSCDGHSSTEAYPGQRQEAEAWESEEPPAGEGWQLWETVSQGSPISPVFPDSEGLAVWLTTPAACWRAMKTPMTLEQARGFVSAGWAPSMVAMGGVVQDGAHFVGSEEASRADLGGAS